MADRQPTPGWTLPTIACLALGGWLCPQPTAAYCLTRTCQDCPRDPETGCATGGEPIRWSSSCISFSLSKAGSSVDVGVATELTTRAFATWQAARCGSTGAPPSIAAANHFGPVACGLHEFSRYSSNANIVLFREDAWPYTTEDAALASTSLTIDREHAEIHDADIEINATLQLAVEHDQVGGVEPHHYDLLSILTHEAGHFLGIDHSRDPGSIMRISLDPGEVRTELGADDVAAICAAYPPELEQICEPTPYGGFSAECAQDASNTTCNLTVPTSRRTNPPAQSLALLLLWFALRRRRRKA